MAADCSASNQSEASIYGSSIIEGVIARVISKSDEREAVQLLINRIYNKFWN